MQIYQFHFFDAAGDVPTLDLSEHPDDGAAARAAALLLDDHGSSRGVEVYQDSRLVLRMERPAGDERPVAPGPPAGDAHRRWRRPAG